MEDPERIVLANDSLSNAYIASLYHRFANKIFDPTQDETATANLLALREKWREQERLTVFSSGVFDLMHPDHMGYLLHVRAAGAAEHYNRQGFEKDWDALDPTQQQEYTTRQLGENAFRLIVSVDGDNSVARRKGSDPEKNSTPRPIYSWLTRAMMVASLSFIDPTDEKAETLLPTVDAVTMHGPMDFPPDSPHSSHFNLVELLQPDVWTVFGESTDIIEGAPNRPNLATVSFRCIRNLEGIHYFEDPIMGRISTTKTVRRIKGEK